ncbi:4'-phosphopantetheinyl transferase superfamily protein [Neolewinella lacunae]|uniref:4'-phosphopantetheinyl transferase superfamily protein n=1 Tax=Neolewinella lacunae TaxID=1517758 RepID=A0A923PIX1_9BACT|nr:4'-phosphopantetheinyl transferase superfamily protein [Neolewinella lacunae]MBC6994139.1 4'-phosphopantetheinyl transferase superfamily protein [Neolewinella lacunae]MDN3636712.1 4'-phosphopantetheinyl transferase superfamily protein [Neolewinella lacunae]
MSAGSHYHRSLAATPWAIGSPERAWPAPGIVEVWRTPLPGTPESAESAYPLLSAGERERAERFYFPADRYAYVRTRGILRRLLAGYLGQRAEDLVFRTNPYGKPYLADHPELAFNLSHGGGYGLFAFTGATTVGIDLESIALDVDTDQFSHRVFSPTERLRVLELENAEERRATFYRTWTRKEAFLKAHGEGLTLPLDQFTVPADLAAPLRIESIKWDPASAETWSLASFMVTEQLPAALVIAGPLKDIRFFDFG